MAGMMGQAKLLSRVEKQCDQLLQSTLRNLRNDYATAYAEGQRELHCEEMVRAKRTLADRFGVHVEIALPEDMAHCGAEEEGSVAGRLQPSQLESFHSRGARRAPSGRIPRS